MMIDLQETGPCSTRDCSNIGTRANGARDIAPMAARTGVFVKTYSCPDCRSAAAQRSFADAITLRRKTPRQLADGPLVKRRARGASN